MKKVTEMNHKEYEAYSRLLQAKQNNSRAEYQDVALIWNSGAFSKIIRFMEANKNDIPNFSKPEKELSDIEKSLLNKIGQYGIDVRFEPETPIEPETFGTITEDRACLWCSTMFTPLNGNHKFCSITCRDKMSDFRNEERKNKRKENKLINGNREE
jgi:predicted nucleic acid-binding Zn ribbon protein